MQQEIQAGGQTALRLLAEARRVAEPPRLFDVPVGADGQLLPGKPSGLVLLQSVNHGLHGLTHAPYVYLGSPPTVLPLSFIALFCSFCGIWYKLRKKPEYRQFPHKAKSQIAVNEYSGCSYP